MDIALSPPANGPRGPRPRMAGHVAITQGSALSDMANLSWFKDAVLAQAAKEVAYERANTPSNFTPAKQGSFQPKSSPI